MTVVPRRVRRARWLAAAALGLAMGACTDDVEVRDEDGVVVAAADWSVFDLRVGDCLNPAADVVGDVSQVPVVPCDEPHAQEVFGLIEHPAGPYPGASAVAVWADGECLVELDASLGKTLDDGLFVSYLLPTFLGWNQDDDRTVVCVLVFPVEGLVTGSVVRDVVDGAS